MCILSSMGFMLLQGLAVVDSLRYIFFAFMAYSNFYYSLSDNYQEDGHAFE